MAGVTFLGENDPKDDPTLSTPGQFLGTADPNGGSPTPAPSSADANPRDAMVARDSGSWEQQLKQQLGGLYDPSILGDVQRNVSYAQNNGQDPADIIKNIVAKNQLRASNEPNSSYTPNGSGGYTTGPTGIVNGAANARAATSVPGGTYSAQGLNYPGSQFSDPYTNLLEQIGKKQIDSLTGTNPQMTQLMDFLNKQFSALSTSQGYTPDELAVLNTQVMAPIEAQRQAAQQRELERTSRAGYLPTSGITLDQQRQIDTSSDQARTAASRDLAINAINRQDAQRQQAANLGLQALQLPQQQNAQALDVANTLYQLPRQAMLDAESVINGSSPQSVISPLIQLQQQQLVQQQLQQQNSAAFANSIGSWLYSLFNGQA